jgi:ATP:corrinoid adenosyltransferase
MARSGLEKAKQAMFSGEYSIVVFDEIKTAY